MSAFTMPDPHHASLIAHIAYDIGVVVVIAVCLAILLSPVILWDWLENR